MEIPAIYENGVFRPLEPIVLPENTPVTVVASQSVSDHLGTNSDDVYALLEERFESGVSDAAARVDELNP